MAIADVLVGVAALRWWNITRNQVVTFTNGTNTVNCTAHGLNDDDLIRLVTDSTGILPAELEENRGYYVVTSAANTFQVALTVGGAAVAFTDDGTAVCFVRSAPQVVTFTNATNVINHTAHGIANDERVQLVTDATGILPAELHEHITYYVVNRAADTFQVALTLAGAAVTFTDDGTAVCYVYRNPVDMGFTSDGVTMALSSETADIRVDQLEGVVKRPILTQDIRVTCNLSEASMENLEVAFPGSLESPADTLTLGGGTYQSGRLNLEGTAPSPATDRTIVLREVSPLGEVGTPYKKGEITIVPVTFSALVDDNDEFGIIVDA